MGQSGDNLERVEVISLAELRNWLSRHHAQADSIWLVTYKKAVADKYLPKADIVDEALCWGWVDSLPRKLDAERTMLLLSPRKTSSVWSTVNKQKVRRLQRDGRLQASGRAKIDAAKQNGMWTFLDDVEALVKPADLVAAFERWPPAAANFDAFPPSSQRGILGWIKLAKTPATRQKRIEKTATLAAKNIMANHPADRRQR